jgi:NADP-dependent 3-hydroxy acid dehydrogenase YdfG
VELSDDRVARVFDTGEMLADVYNLTKFGVNGFTKALHAEVTQRHERVGVHEPGGVATELGSHNRPQIRGG